MPKNPYRSTPIVHNNELKKCGQLVQVDATEKRLMVGSEEWFEWLKTASRFACKVWISSPNGPFMTLTLRCELKQRGGRYWVAYAKDKTGKLQKAYAGRPESLDVSRLETVKQLLIEKLGVSYPTSEGQLEYGIVFEVKSRVSRPKRQKEPKYPPLTRSDLKQFHIFSKMLHFCSEEFENRWGRPWRWAGGRIVRSHLEKGYFVWAKESNEHEYLADKRYFIMTRLLHWVNHGYDTGYKHQLPNS